MPNALLTPGNIADVAANLVGKDLGLSRLVHRDIEASYAGGLGATVQIRVPGAVVARERSNSATTALVSDTLTEQTVPVTLDTETYSKVLIDDKMLDLDLKDFGKQVLAPQARGIAVSIEKALAAALIATPATTGITYTATAPAKAFTAIRAALRTAGVSAEATIHAVVGTKVYGDLLDAVPSTAGVTFDENGVTVRGVLVHESNRIDSKAIVAFVPEAFALVVRAPLAPEGAPYSASIKTENGDFALRHIRAFDAGVGADASICTAFVKVTPLPLAVDAEDGAVTLVPNAGAVRIATP